MNFDKFFDRHEKVMLQFSAGKDSAACLYLLEPYWDRMDVVWLNTGNPPSAARKYMDHMATILPRFREVQADQPAWVKANGYPTDVLPVLNTQCGQDITRSDDVRFVSFLDCCSANQWRPMADAILSGGYTGVIRGEKNSDHLKGPLHSGSVVDGIEFLFPIEHWSDESVIEFLGPNIPDTYKRGLPVSLDCRNCTAYVADHPKWLEDMQYTEPEAVAEVKKVYRILEGRLYTHLKHLRESLE